MIELEVCCGSFADAAAAERGGATRIELNSALFLGGLTPDIGSVRLCVEQIKIPVIAMLRPRDGGFCYTPDEFLAMEKSAECLLQAGVDGLAFGFLTKECGIDTKRTAKIAALAHSYGKEAVFHRAFDCVPSFSSAAEQLIDAGIDRILTSGGKATASAGWLCLRDLQTAYGDRIEILAGSGVRSENVAKLLVRTGICQIHSSCKGYLEDFTARGNDVSFSSAGAGDEWYRYDAVSERTVGALAEQLLSYENERECYEDL